MHRVLAVFIIGSLALLCVLAASAQAARSTDTTSRWQPGIFYEAGKMVTFENASYKCMYAHTSVGGWEPANAVGLWAPMGIPRRVSKNNSKDAAQHTKRIFAPYIHMTETNNALPAILEASGTRFFTLAFIVSDGDCTPAWQGKTPLKLATESLFSSYIERIRRSKGDVIISFGGYASKELAMACPDVTTLAAAYQSVVDKYKVKSLDFDVEASAATDAPSIQRRSEALAKLAKENPGLQISFTVPVLPNGMPQTALELLRSAKENKVPVSVVNLMTMDYGQPVLQGNMGPAGILGVEAAMVQLHSLGLEPSIGITPMIGVNDTPGETFTLADADAILRYSRSNRAVRRLSMWSVGRDRSGCTGSVSPVCSGIDQADWDFAHILQRF